MHLRYVKLSTFFALVLLLIMGGVLAGSVSQAKETSMDIAPVWSGHPVGFALLSCPDMQYIAFYDADRKLTVGSRELSETTWHFVKLPETLGWDSHNYINMAMDDSGCMHLCANMHVSPLVYFRMAKPGDIDSFERIPAMVGRDEAKCTYPSFFRGPGGSFLFTYRSGSSGNGDQFYNVYDHKTKTWRRLMDKPLTSGEGKMNAYFYPMRLGPDGYYHMIWVWRDTPDCETNHDLSYARSRDLVHWETSAGKPLDLPITVKTADIVAPVPVKCGLINGGIALGFDSKNRVVISYQKYDEQGYSQLYNARLENGRWKTYKTSSWAYHWEFKGRGCILFEIGIGPVVVEKDGRLSQNYSHAKYGNGKFILSEDDFEPIEDIHVSKPAPKPADDQPDKLQSRSCGDSGSSGEPGVAYSLHWETLPVNRDQPRQGPVPPPSMLKLIRTEKTAHK